MTGRPAGVKPISISRRSRTALRITMMVGEETLAVGSAFLVDNEGVRLLVTARHNVTGRRQDDGTPLSFSAGIPDRIAIAWPRQRPVGPDASTFECHEFSVPLNGQWFEHPTLGAQADIVALPTEHASLPFDDAALAVNVSPIYEESRAALSVSDDVFVVGFPRGLTVRSRLPIWKRATIASEPMIDVEKLPLMYIDGDTMEGLSGAPVFHKKTGAWAPEGSTMMSHDTVLGEGWRFVGLYSGRTAKIAGARLGIVWKESAILETAFQPAKEESE